MTAKNKTYANILKTTIKDATSPAKPVINLTNKHHLKWVFLILETHIASGDGRPYNVILEESLKANNIEVKIPKRDSQKIMDIYLNKKKDCVPKEFLYESSSDENSDKEELQPPPPPPNGGRSTSPNTRTIRQPEK